MIIGVRCRPVRGSASVPVVLIRRDSCQASALPIAANTIALARPANTLTLNKSSNMRHAANTSERNYVPQTSSDMYFNDRCTATCNFSARHCTRAGLIDTPPRIPRRMHKIRPFLP